MRNNRWYSIRLSILGVMALALALLAHARPTLAGEVKKFTMVNVLIDGTKIWLPSNLTVQAGDEVELTLNNTLTAPHGFKLAPFEVEVKVPSKRKRIIRFTASQAGIHPYVCQLHAAHIGGQLVVLDR